MTDDPEPTEFGHWEIYNFVSAVHAEGATAGQGGFDINYGGAQDLQLTTVVPANYQSPGRIGLGEIELAAKYRFVHQADDGWMPDVAFFPRVFLPTAGRQFGPARVSYFLPFWAQKDWGGWSLFGGGGYEVNPGPGNRNFWLGGLALSRAITDKFALGAEIFDQTPAATGQKAFAAVNAGATYGLTDHWSLIASGGPGVQSLRGQGQYDFYVALEATY